MTHLEKYSEDIAKIACSGELFEKKASEGKAYNHLIILFKNAEGYKNGCELLTRSHTEGFYYNSDAADPFSLDDFDDTDKEDTDSSDEPEKPEEHEEPDDVPEEEAEPVEEPVEESTSEPAENSAEENPDNVSEIQEEPEESSDEEDDDDGEAILID